jgi:hypothetical protein
LGKSRQWGQYSIKIVVEDFAGIQSKPSLISGQSGERGEVDDDHKKYVD